MKRPRREPDEVTNLWFIEYDLFIENDTRYWFKMNCRITDENVIAELENQLEIDQEEDEEYGTLPGNEA